MRYIKLTKSTDMQQAIYWQYKTKFRANNYKGTQRKFANKEAVPKQALKQKRFHEYYC